MSDVIALAGILAASFLIAAYVQWADKIVGHDAQQTDQ